MARLIRWWWCHYISWKNDKQTHHTFHFVLLLSSTIPIHPSDLIWSIHLSMHRLLSFLFLLNNCSSYWYVLSLSIWRMNVHSPFLQHTFLYSVISHHWTLIAISMLMLLLLLLSVYGLVVLLIMHFLFVWFEYLDSPRTEIIIVEKWSNRNNHFHFISFSQMFWFGLVWWFHQLAKQINGSKKKIPIPMFKFVCFF